MAYKNLTSEKYWRASALSEIAQAKEAQTSQSIRTFNMFLVFYLVLIGCTFLLKQNPDWLLPILAFVEQTGITEQLRAIVVR